MTKELEKAFAKIGRQEDSPNPIAVVKFFKPAVQGTCHATELYYVVKIDRPGEEPEIIEVEASKLKDSKSRTSTPVTLPFSRRIWAKVLEGWTIKFCKFLLHVCYFL